MQEDSKLLAGLARVEQHIISIDDKLSQLFKRTAKIDELVYKHDKMLTVRMAERKQNNKIIATLFTVFLGVASYIGNQILENYTAKQDKKVDVKIEKRLSEWSEENKIISNNNNNEL